MLSMLQALGACFALMPLLYPPLLLLRALALSSHACKSCKRACLAAGVLDVLRLAMETRKVMLVDIALDLVQKLIAHHHLAGAVHAIAHKSDAASATRPARRRTNDEDDIPEAAADAPMPPQVRALSSLASAQHGHDCRSPTHGLMQSRRLQALGARLAIGFQLKLFPRHAVSECPQRCMLAPAHAIFMRSQLAFAMKYAMKQQHKHIPGK